MVKVVRQLYEEEMGIESRVKIRKDFSHSLKKKKKEKKKAQAVHGSDSAKFSHP